MELEFNFALRYFFNQVNNYCLSEIFLIFAELSTDSCSPPQLALNGTETEDGDVRIRKDYSHVREVKFSGSIGPLGEKRLCKIKCIGGQWVGPLCVNQQGKI